MSREATYSEAARLIRETEPETNGDPVLLLSSLHGHAGARTDSAAFESVDATQSRALAEFRSAILERLRADWQMRHVVSFVSQERMQEFLERLAGFPAQSRLEVRATVHNDGVPAISTLVVARRSAMLATDDDRVYGVGAGVRLDGPEFVRWVENYFDELWSNAQFTIWRPATGKDDTQVEALRNALAPDDDNGYMILRGGPDVYAAATLALNSALEQPNEIKIALANVHGLSTGPRVTRNDLEQEWIVSFEQALDRCLLENSHRCRMQAIYNVDSEGRLRAVEGYLSRWAKADYLEVRAIVVRDAVATISPLVIGEHEFFLGAEDDRLYRSARAVRIRGTDAATWGREYFELLWNDRRAIRLRTVNGNSEEGLAELKARLRDGRESNAN